MKGHIDLLGWLYIAYSAVMFVVGALLGLGVAIGGTLVFAELERTDPGALAEAPLVAPIAIAIAALAAVVVALWPIPGFVAGIGLLKRRPWARTLAVILAIPILASIPVGTALGAYSVWVLLFNEETHGEFAAT